MSVICIDSLIGACMGLDVANVGRAVYMYIRKNASLESHSAFGPPR